MTLAQWLAYLETLHPASIALGLDRVAEVRARMQLRTPFRIITVGGTNGKGSTVALLEAMLAAGGFRVGCYTSPHLLRYNERVRIDQREADDANLINAFQRVEAARKDTPLTYFEMGTLAAMSAFEHADLDYAVLEIGLGGRLDAVNLFDPDCAIVTSVDLDHMEYLGETREAIGYEKAHIFRAGKPAICSAADVPASVRQYAAQIGARYYELGNDFTARTHAAQWDFEFGETRRTALPYPTLRGSHQIRNAAAALAALTALEIPLAQQAIRNGLTLAKPRGRFTVLPGDPSVILDVAHNPESARALAATLRTMPPARTLAVFGMFKDKDITAVLNTLAGEINHWHVGSLPGPRGAHASDIAALSPGPVSTHATVADAWRAARRDAARNDRIVVFGSFLTVAAVMELSHAE